MSLVGVPWSQPNGNGGGSSSTAVARVALSTRFPAAYPTIFVDPVAGNNANPGTSAAPIKDTSFLNTKAFLTYLTADTTITYKSDDPGTVALDLSSVDMAGFTLTIAGTPQVVHAGGAATINAGTVAINPAAAGGGQRQQVHTSDIADWTPYVPDARGGTAAHPVRVVDAVSGDGAWVFGEGEGNGTANCARPVRAAGTAGTITIGNGYSVQRGSTLVLAQSPLPVDSVGTSLVVFSDLAFGAASWGPVSSVAGGFLPSGDQLVTYKRCAWDGICTVGGFFSDCFFAADISTLAEVTLSAGVLIGTGQFTRGALNLSGDVVVTGYGLAISPIFGTDVYIYQGIGAGAQFQDCSAPGALFLENGLLFTDVLVWGNGNAHLGLAVNSGRAHFNKATPPTVTGTEGDFGFVNASGTVTTARAWDDTASVQTGQTATAKVKAAAQFVTNSTVLVNDDTAFLAIGAGETWSYEWQFKWTINTAGSEPKVAVTVPAGATLLSTFMTISSAGTATASTTTAAGTALDVAPAAPIGTGVTCFRVTVVNGATPGTVQFQWAQQAAGATATTIAAGASFIATKAGSQSTASGSWTTTRTTTWAHFAASIAAGGFNWTANDVASDAAVVAA